MTDILICDDEEKIREITKDFFENEGFHVDEAGNGLEAYIKISNKKYDALILDVMMPVLDGIKACAKIREISSIPIIILTAKNEEDDYIDGFKHGADDYVAKPFSNKILIERVKALLRRTGKKEKRYDYGKLKLDMDSMKAFFEGKELKLTATEYDLLYVLMENENIALSRERIIDRVWGYNYSGDPRNIDTHIKNLRKKLNESYIETIRGHGYRFEVDK